MSLFSKKTSPATIEAAPAQSTIADIGLESDSLNSSLDSTTPAISIGAITEHHDVNPAEVRTGTLQRRHRNIRFTLLGLFLVAGVILVLLRLHAPAPADNTLNSSVGDRYSTINFPLQQLTSNGGNSLSSVGSVTVNGQLNVNGGLILTPSLQPSAPVVGQLYYDKTTNQLSFYDGSIFNALATSNGTVTGVGGQSGDIGLGSGLGFVNGKLSYTGGNANVLSVQGETGAVTLVAGGGININGTTVSNGGVLSLQGQTGDVNLVAGSGITISGTTISSSGVSTIGGQNGAITLGSGLSLSGSTLQNSGIISATAGANIAITNDGSGNIVISSTALGGGSVSSPGGTSGHLAKFTGAQTIADSLLTESGSVVTVGGDLTVTGALTLSSPLSVAQGGTGANNLTANGVLIGNGTSAITSLTTGVTGNCLLSTAGIPAFLPCPGSGVASINGITGVIAITNAVGSGSTITLNSAKADGSTKGVATFSATNFMDNGSGLINTIQGIATTSTPTFAGLSLGSSGLNAAGTITFSGSGFTTDGIVTAVSGVLGSGSISLNSSSYLTGTLGVSKGGTGLGSLTANQLLYAGSSSSISQVASGTSGECLISNGSGSAPSFQTCGGAGGVSSINSQNGALTFTGTANEVTISNTGGIFTLATPQAIGTASSPTFATIIANSGINTGAGAGTSRIDASGNLTNIGTITASGLIQGGGLTISSGTITLNNLTGGSNQCLTLDASNVVGVATCATGGGSTPTLQNVYDNSATSPIINLSSSGKGVIIKDNASPVGGNLLSVTDSIGTAYFAVTTGGIIGVGSGITSLDASNVSAGTLNDSRLSSNVALLSSNNNFTGTTLQHNGHDVCDTSGNCVGAGAGSAIGGSGTANQIAIFTGSGFTIGDSIVSQDSGATVVTIAGDLSVTGGISATTLSGDGSAITSVNAATLGGNASSFYTDAANITSGLLSDSRLNSDVTLQGNSFNGVNELVQLNGSGVLPALSGANLTNLNGTNISSGIVATTYGGTGLDGSSAANGQLLIGTGSGYSLGTLTQGSGITITNASGSITIASSGTTGAAGGDLSGTYPNPTVAKIRGTNVSFTSIASGDVLQYNGTNIINSHITDSNLTAGTFSNVTGTGALSAGSIATGFGTIATTNTISTNNTIQGNLINSTTGYQFNGTPGSSVACSSGQFLQNQVVQGGIVTGGSCASAGGGASPTLQDVYNNSVGGVTPEIMLDTTRMGLNIQGYSGQTSDFFTITDSFGTAYFSINPLTGLFLNGDINIIGDATVDNLTVRTDALVLGNIHADGDIRSDGTIFTDNIDSVNPGGTIIIGENNANTIILGTSADGLTFTYGSGIVATGSAQHVKTLTLPAAYAGAIVNASNDGSCSANNTGTMSNDYDNSNRMNYYDWTANNPSTAQCKDVVVQVPIPSDFSSWAASGALSVQMKKDATGTASYAIQIIDSGNTNDANYNYSSPGTLGTSWANMATSSFGAGTYTAGNYFTIKVRMSSTNNANVFLGNIFLKYNSSF